MKKLSKKGFTLVELIIVIAIIAILAVTAFLMLTKWLSKARDASRNSNVANIEKSLQISLTENGNLPKPDNYTLIYASGTTNVVGYQGDFGEGVKDTVGNINSAPKDGDDYFLYYLDDELKNYQIGSFLENDVAYNPNSVSAEDYSSRYIRLNGSELGLLLGANNAPVNKLGLTGVDIVNTTTAYNAYFSSNNVTTGTGKQLFTRYYNIRKTLLANPDVASFDPSLVFYSNMETLSGTMLRDFSQYHNDGELSGTTFPQSTDAKMGKGLYFTGPTSYISVPTSDSLNIYDSSITNVALVKADARLPFPTASTYRQYALIYKYNNYILWNDDDPSAGGMNIRFADTLGHGLTTKYNFGIGNYYLFISVYDKSDNLIRNYINGIKVQESTPDGTGRNAGTSNNALLIGGSGGANGQFFGVMDEVRIYNRALSDAEVKALSDVYK